MDSMDLTALAETFYQNLKGECELPGQRDFWIAAFSNFAAVVLAAAPPADRNDLALKKISDVASRNYEQLTPQDRLIGAGRALRSILDVAMLANGREKRNPHAAVRLALIGNTRRGSHEVDHR